jgi:hypothetical protein
MRARSVSIGKKVLKLARPYSDRPLQSPHDIGQSEHDIDEDRVEGHVADAADDGERIAHALGLRGCSMSAPGSRAKCFSSSVKGWPRSRSIASNISRSSSLSNWRAASCSGVSGGDGSSGLNTASSYLGGVQRRLPISPSKNPIRAQIANDLVELDRLTINAAAVAKLQLPASVLFFPSQDDPFASQSLFPP